MAQIQDLIRDYLRACESVAVLGEVTPRALDYAMGLGEHMSARQVAAALRMNRIPAQAVDATDLIVTNDCFQNAAPQPAATCANIQRVIAPLLEAGKVPVITGYIGATETGIPTTLGRGGSDYSAALIGVGLESDELWIWTDVDGVMSGDPRITPDARTVETLTYREVSELAYYGAKVLHPKFIRPALEAGIAIRVKNTFNPDAQGTEIVANGHCNGVGGHAAPYPHRREAAPTFKAVTAIRDVGMITVAGTGMLGVPGMAARTFATTARAATNVLLITQSSSEQSICFVVPAANVELIVRDLNAAFEREIARRDIDRIAAKSPLTIVTVVGAGLQQTPGVAARIFGALAEAGVNVIAIAQGSSECGISFVIDAPDTEAAVRAVHALIVEREPVFVS